MLAIGLEMGRSPITCQSRLAISSLLEIFDDLVATPLLLKNFPLLPSTTADEARNAVGRAPSTAKVLLQLQTDGALTMRNLAGQLQYDASNLTGVVDRLEALGLVRRQSHPSDRRAKGVMLTDEGMQVRQAFWQQLTNNSGPLGRLNSRQLANLRALLRSAMPGAMPAEIK